MYKVNYLQGKPTSIQREEDNANIPFNTDNRDFVEFLEWNKIGKLDYVTPIEVEPPEPVESLEDKITRIATVIAKEEIADGKLEISKQLRKYARYF